MDARNYIPSQFSHLGFLIEGRGCLGLWLWGLAFSCLFVVVPEISCICGCRGRAGNSPVLWLRLPPFLSLSEVFRVPGCANGRKLGRGFEWKVGQFLLILSPFPISACENKACLLLVFSLLVIGPGCQKEGWKYFGRVFGRRSKNQKSKRVACVQARSLFPLLSVGVIGWHRMV